VVLVLLAVVLIGAFRAAALLLIFGGYALSAPTVWLFRKLRRRNRPSAAPQAFITPPMEPPAPPEPAAASPPGEPPVANHE
jgi:hypothetical protein